MIGHMFLFLFLFFDPIVRKQINWNTGLPDSGEPGEEPEPNDPADDGDEIWDEDEGWEEEAAEDDPTIKPHEEPMDDVGDTEKDCSWWKKLTETKSYLFPSYVFCAQLNETKLYNFWKFQLYT